MDEREATIETERLILRPPRLEDFDRYAELLGDETAARYIGGHMVRAAAWRRFLQMPGAWAVQGFAMFSVIERDSGRWLGQAGPWRPEGWPGNEVGWSFHPDAWGRGYATEAAVAALDWAFAHLGWDEVIHCIDPDNAPSQKLAQRLGSRNLGPGRMPPPYEEALTDIWGQTRAQWRARAGTVMRAGDDALQRSLADLLPRLAAARLRDPWWVIGSAAAVLAGVDGFAPHDVDLLLSARDADALIAAYPDAVDAGYAPADDGRFRSRFARFTFAPMPVEAMGGLDVFRHGAWRPVEIGATLRVALAGGEIRIPTLPEQLRLFEWFGRDKDLAKARRLRAYLAAGDTHAA